MKSNQLISVIIPIFNLEEYIEECLQSVVSQTYKNLEIILVDDGSKDRSGEICDEWEKKDERIIVIHKENGGISSARNVALDIFKGEYLCFVDGDDTIDEKYVELLYKNIEDNDSQMSLCRYYRWDFHSATYIYSDFDNSITKCLDWRSFMKMVYENNFYATCWGKMFKRNLFDSIRYPIGKTHEDSSVILDIAIKCNRISRIDNALYFYRMRSDSIMNERNSLLYLDDFEWIEKHIRKLIELKEDELIFEAKKLFCHYVIKNHRFLGKESRKIIMDKYINYYKDIMHSKYMTSKRKFKYLTFGNPILLKGLMIFNFNWRG